MREITLEELMMNEIWKLHSSGLLVSNFARVFVPKSGKRKEHITTGCDDGKGYLQVIYKGKKYRIHRLVAECFLDNPNGYTEVNHKDENKQNNHVDNLEWCTPSYNINYGTRNERVAEKCSKIVLQYDKNMNLIREWQSTKECGKNGFDQGTIVHCCRGERKTHKGYKWRYKDDEGQ